MTVDDEIISLKNEIVSLKARMADLHDALRLECESSTQMFEAHGRRVSEIYEYIWHLIHRVFPGYGRARSDVEAFLRKLSDSKDQNPL